MDHDISHEVQIIAPVVHKKKGILLSFLLQKFKDGNDTADMSEALSSLARGLELAKKQCKDHMRADAELKLLCADILEPVAELAYKINTRHCRLLVRHRSCCPRLSALF